MSKGEGGPFRFFPRFSLLFPVQGAYFTPPHFPTKGYRVFSRLPLPFVCLWCPRSFYFSSLLFRFLQTRETLACSFPSKVSILCGPPFPPFFFWKHIFTAPSRQVQEHVVPPRMLKSGPIFSPLSFSRQWHHHRRVHAIQKIDHCFFFPVRPRHNFWVLPREQRALFLLPGKGECGGPSPPLAIPRYELRAFFPLSPPSALCRLLPSD